MDKNLFAKKITTLEGKRKEINIANVKEIMRVINKLTKGAFYKIIELM